jgi:hypothetical protein
MQPPLELKREENSNFSSLARFLIARVFNTFHELFSKAPISLAGGADPNNPIKEYLL